MGLSTTSMDRFRDRIDETLRELFPAKLRIAGVEIMSAGPGGRVVSDYIDGGLAPSYRFPFRIPAAEIREPLRVGTPLEWIVSDAIRLDLEIAETPQRPHENAVHVVCKRRVAK